MSSSGKERTFGGSKGSVLDLTPGTRALKRSRGGVSVPTKAKAPMPLLECAADAFSLVSAFQTSAELGALLFTCQDIARRTRTWLASAKVVHHTQSKYSEHALDCIKAPGAWHMLGRWYPQQDARRSKLIGAWLCKWKGSLNVANLQPEGEAFLQAATLLQCARLHSLSLSSEREESFNELEVGSHPELRSLSIGASIGSNSSLFLDRLARAIGPHLSTLAMSTKLRSSWRGYETAPAFDRVSRLDLDVFPYHYPPPSTLADTLRAFSCLTALTLRNTCRKSLDARPSNVCLPALTSLHILDFNAVSRYATNAAWLLPQFHVPQLLQLRAAVIEAADLLHFLVKCDHLECVDVRVHPGSMQSREVRPPNMLEWPNATEVSRLPDRLTHFEVEGILLDHLGLCAFSRRWNQKLEVFSVGVRDNVRESAVHGLFSASRRTLRQVHLEKSNRAAEYMPLFSATPMLSFPSPSPSPSLSPLGHAPPLDTSAPEELAPILLPNLRVLRLGTFASAQMIEAFRCPNLETLECRSVLLDASEALRLFPALTQMSLAVSALSGCAAPHEASRHPVNSLLRTLDLRVHKDAPFVARDGKRPLVLSQYDMDWRRAKEPPSSDGFGAPDTAYARIELQIRNILLPNLLRHCPQLKSLSLLRVAPGSACALALEHAHLMPQLSTFRENTSTLALFKRNISDLWALKERCPRLSFLY